MSAFSQFAFWRVPRRSGRTKLTLVSIAIGIAGVVAVWIAASNLRRVYLEMLAGATDRTTIEVAPEGGGFINESLTEKIGKTPGVKVALPVIQKRIVLRPGEGRKNVAVDCMGIDPARDGAIRDYKVVSGRMIEAGKDEAVLDAEFAEGCGITVGQEIKLFVGRKQSQPCKVVGLLATQSSAAARMTNLLFVPLDCLQHWLERKGEISSIRIVTEDGICESSVIALLARQLPEGVVAQRPAAQMRAMDLRLQVKEQFRTTTGLALALAAFTILNSFLMNIGASPRFAIVGLVIFIVSGSALAGYAIGWLPGDSEIVSSVFVMIGLALLAPEPLSLVATHLFRPATDIEARLARHQTVSHRIRVTLTLGTLFAASAFVIYLVSTGLSGIRDVRRWREKALDGDFVIRSAMPSMIDGVSADLSSTILEELRKIPGVADIDSCRVIQARVDDRAVTIFAREYTSKTGDFFDLRQGNRATIRDRLFAGDVVVGTKLAQQAKLKCGGEVVVNTRVGATRLKIAGIATDYMFSGMVVSIERGTAMRLLEIDGYDAFIINCEPGQSAEVHKRLKALCKSEELMLTRFDDLKQAIDETGDLFRQCFLALSLIVAATTVVNGLWFILPDRSLPRPE